MVCIHALYALVLGAGRLEQQRAARAVLGPAVAQPAKPLGAVLLSSAVQPSPGMSTSAAPPSQMYVYRPLTYRGDHASTAALETANRVMQALSIPGELHE
jgi:hypothetical protein